MSKNIINTINLENIVILTKFVPKGNGQRSKPIELETRFKVGLIDQYHKNIDLSISESKTLMYYKNEKFYIKRNSRRNWWTSEMVWGRRRISR